MTSHRLWSTIVLMLLFLSGARAIAQQGALKSVEVTPFLGTWVLNMTTRAGALETVRIVDNDGIASASVHAGRFPPIMVSAMVRDGDMLVLTATRFENGKPIRAVITLILDGDTMHMAQMLEFSLTIKRGSGKKQ